MANNEVVPGMAHEPLQKLKETQHKEPKKQGKPRPQTKMRAFAQKMQKRIGA